jgi:hypothetical protein
LALFAVECKRIEIKMQEEKQKPEKNEQEKSISSQISPSHSLIPITRRVLFWSQDKAAVATYHLPSSFSTFLSHSHTLVGLFDVLVAIAKLSILQLISINTTCTFSAH